MFDTYQIIAIGTTIGVFALLQIRRSIPIDLLFLSGLLIVSLSGILTPREAVAGFSNPAVLTIGGLFAISAGLRACGILDWVGDRLLGSVDNEKGALWRLAITLISTSAFLLNTALVAMMAPIVAKWCRRHRISPSRLLIPVSYLAILGGVCTLIGTSTTLVVNAELQLTYENQTQDLQRLIDQEADPGIIQKQQAYTESVRPMALFELGKVGLPCALIGAVFMLVVGPKLLPNRMDLIDQLDDQRREYIVEMMVRSDCRLVGKTVSAAGLRHLHGLFLIEIDRNDNVITPITPDNVIQANDRLIFSGVVDTILELEKFPGLVPAGDSDYELNPKQRRNRNLTEVVLSSSSPLIGSNVRRARFRKRYNAAVVAVHRNGERLTNKIGDIRLQPGDTLLLQTNADFVNRYRNSKDFYLVSSVAGSEPPALHKMPIAAAIFLGLLVWLVLASLFGLSGQTWASPAIAVLVALVLMVTSGSMRMVEARSAVDLQLLITIACALGLGLALERSGAASQISTMIVEGVGDNPYVLLAVVYLITMILTEMITNNAVAALMFPIAINMAQASGMNPRPFLITICLAASLAFITPIGYQTNLMVMGPGGYRASDYVRCGLPLSITVATVAIILIPQFWPF